MSPLARQSQILGQVKLSEVRDFQHDNEFWRDMGELLSAPEHGVTRVEWDKFISSLPQVVEDRPGLYQLIYFTASRCTGGLD